MGAVGSKLGGAALGAVGTTKVPHAGQAWSVGPIIDPQCVHLMV